MGSIKNGGSSGEHSERINMDWLTGKHGSQTDGYTGLYLLLCVLSPVGCACVDPALVLVHEARLS